LNQNRAPLFGFDAFSLREPVSTSLENAIARAFTKAQKSPGRCRGF
jgi:hypothetical protein